MSEAATAATDRDRTACWCCGSIGEPDRMVRLGNHPEVTLCLPCARWAAKQAAAIEDERRTGLLVSLLVSLRGRLRELRSDVIRRGWHRNPVVGRVIRRIGRYWP